MDSASGRSIRRTVIAATAAASLLGLAPGARAQEQSRSFDVVIQLRTFSAPPVADHRCTHQPQREPVARVRLSCPSAAQVHAVAHRLARAGTPQAGQGDTAPMHLPPPGPGEAPIEVTIAW